MRAYLARHVYRRALVSRGPIFRCPLISASGQRSIPIPNNSPRRIHRRTFFGGIFQKAPREIRKPEYEPGWTVVLTWRNRVLDKVRPPSRKELVSAFRDLFKYKERYNVSVNSTQARHCRNLLVYIIENKSEEPGLGLTLDDMTMARDALLKDPKEDTSEHLAFSRTLFHEIRKERPAAGQTEAGLYAAGDSPTTDDFKAYLWALTTFGASDEALVELRKHWEALKAAGVPTDSANSLWIQVLRGFSLEGREAALLETAAEAKQLGLKHTPRFHGVLTTFYARLNRVKETKQWFSKTIDDQKLPTHETYREILMFSYRNKQRDWTMPIFQQLVDSNPSKQHWDVVYQWSVLSLGKGLDDLRTMFEVVRKHNPGDLSALPDIHTINGLVEVAVEKNDPYLVERLMSFARELGLMPNAATYILQLESRLKAKDLSSAKEAYRSLTHQTVEGEEDLPVINRYLQALCDGPKPDLQTIRDLMSNLEKRIVTLEPNTIVALCTVFLKFDQQFDIIDTLSLNIFQHSIDQRKSVRDAFISYCMDSNNSTARIWDAYTILRQFFLETSVQDRVKLMQAFFDRKRPDMAIHVFGHMRQHVNRDFHPTPEVYIRCLEGLGQCADSDSEENLALIHNMLKMDLRMQPSTKLYNALMLAYAACDQPARALDFWNDIVHSAEGPSYNSLEIVFSVCEKMPFGDKKVKDIWKRIQTLEIDVPPSVFAAYAGGLAGNGNIQAVQDAIKTVQQTCGYGPDTTILGVAHNALPGQGLQRRFADWANEMYPQIWAQVKKKRVHRAGNGLIKYRLGRDLKA